MIPGLHTLWSFWVPDTAVFPCLRSPAQRHRPSRSPALRSAGVPQKRRAGLSATSSGTWETLMLSGESYLERSSGDNWPVSFSDFTGCVLESGLQCHVKKELFG